ncbi:hypothetical protein [Methanosarcina sp.]|uniref:hypothetical protein n=1 Tax=Methanosarcina sp. TaxID=2213 RepID=UPI003BB7A695
MFQIFDSQNKIYRIPVTPGSTNTSTGDWTQEAEADPVAITGHTSDLSLKELQALPPGLLETGARKFATDDDLRVGDRLRITESDGSVISWNVHSILNENSILKKFTGSNRLRRTFLIRKP